MKLLKNHGVHIVADFYGCNFLFFRDFTKKQIKSFFSEIVKVNGLRELNTFCYFFSEKNSFTLLTSLAESHLAIHTWPEDKYVSLDIFVCNYTFDQSANAKKIYYTIKKVFSPKIVKKTILKR